MRSHEATFKATGDFPCKTKDTSPQYYCNKMNVSTSWRAPGALIKFSGSIVGFDRVKREFEASGSCIVVPEVNHCEAVTAPEVLIDE